MLFLLGAGLGYMLESLKAAFSMILRKWTRRDGAQESGRARRRISKDCPPEKFSSEAARLLEGSPLVGRQPAYWETDCMLEMTIGISERKTPLRGFSLGGVCVQKNQSSKACFRSAIKSSTFSMPTERRIRSGATPASRSCSSVS